MLNVRAKSQIQKVLFILGLVILIMAAYFTFSNKKKFSNNYPDFKTISYKLQAKSYNLLVADTPEKWGRGLMFFRKLDKVDGMIFLFPEKDYRTFWNKNTLMDLKLLWLDDDTVVGESNLPSIEKSKEIVTVNSPKPANKVIELPL